MHHLISHRAWPSWTNAIRNGSKFSQGAGADTTSGNAGCRDEEEYMPTKKPKPTDVLVGQRVRMARLMANMSQTELGEHIGITFQQVQKYEKRGNRNSWSRLTQISEVLGKPVSGFFNEGRGKAAAKLDGAPDILQRM